MRFQEKELLDIPEWDGEIPVAFVGCHEGHFQWKQRHLPKCKYIHFVHTFNPALMGNASGRDCAVLHRKGEASLKKHHRPSSVTLLSPSYNPEPVWTWAPSSPWSEMSRPAERPKPYLDRMNMVSRAIGTFSVYGQGQKMGFLAGEARKKRLSSSSCYVALFGEDAGFSLAAHEAMASGVPLVARCWGDLPDDARGHPGLASSDQELLDIARRCCVDRAFAEEVGAAGLDYIRRCRTMDRLSETASTLLSRVTSS